MFLLLSTVGLVVVVIVAQSRQNIFSKAWSGLKLNIENLTGLSQLEQAPPLTPQPESPDSSRNVYYKLAGFYEEAEKQVISNTELGLEGNAFFHYSPTIQKTFVFSQISGLPQPKAKIAKLWLLFKDNSVEPVGTVEFFPDTGGTTGYSVFVKDGDLRSNAKKLVFSYDSSESTFPEAPVIELDF